MASNDTGAQLELVFPEMLVHISVLPQFLSSSSPASTVPSATLPWLSGAWEVCRPPPWQQVV